MAGGRAGPGILASLSVFPMALITLYVLSRNWRTLWQQPCYPLDWVIGTGDCPHEMKCLVSPEPGVTCSVGVSGMFSVACFLLAWLWSGSRRPLLLDRCFSKRLPEALAP
jgi:hypothetical protein